MSSAALIAAGALAALFAVCLTVPRTDDTLVARASLRRLRNALALVVHGAQNGRLAERHAQIKVLIGRSSGTGSADIDRCVAAVDATCHGFLAADGAHAGGPASLDRSESYNTAFRSAFQSFRTAAEACGSLASRLGDEKSIAVLRRLVDAMSSFATLPFETELEEEVSGSRELGTALLRCIEGGGAQRGLPPLVGPGGPSSPSSTSHESEAALVAAAGRANPVGPAGTAPGPAHGPPRRAGAALVEQMEARGVTISSRDVHELAVLYHTTRALAGSDELARRSVAARLREIVREAFRQHRSRHDAALEITRAAREAAQCLRASLGEFAASARVVSAAAAEATTEQRYRRLAAAREQVGEERRWLCLTVPALSVALFAGLVLWRTTPLPAVASAVADAVTCAVAAGDAGGGGWTAWLGAVPGFGALAGARCLLRRALLAASALAALALAIAWGPAGLGAALGVALASAALPVAADRGAALAAAAASGPALCWATVTVLHCRDGRDALRSYPSLGAGAVEGRWVLVSLLLPAAAGAATTAAFAVAARDLG